MLTEEITSIHGALGAVLSRVDVESADVVRLCRRNLTALAEQVAELENRLVPDTANVPSPCRLSCKHGESHATA